MIHKYDFGKIVFNTEAEYAFCYSNIGKHPLIIEKVKTDCGCAIPIWSRLETLPGESDTLVVKYDSLWPGSFLKSISVFYNGMNSPEVLTI